jgi:hypothetical protein
VRSRVEREIREGEGAVLAGRATQQGAQAGEELLERERLDEVVVRAARGPATRSSMSCLAVSISTGVRLPIRLRAVQVSIPSITGMRMSRTIASTVCPAMDMRACCPSVASSTS